MINVFETYWCFLAEFAPFWSEVAITVSGTKCNYLTVSLFGLACLPWEYNQLALVLFKSLNISLKGFCRPVFSPVVN